ncbi:alanine racemase [Macrococcus psychrotolerans]|uniref:Alanine racemase n=1 Tax=Macrococcus psychrotolerans TaxID=3039389 RepID=A0AAU6REN0_9STAP
MSDRYYRPTFVNVNLDAIRSNFKDIEKLHPNKTVIAVIKANGYGLGSVNIAKYLMASGTEFFAVATLDEAIELRMHGIKAKILVLGVVDPKHIRQASRHRLALTAPDAKWVEDASRYIEAEDKPVWLHIKVDSGMGRIGVQTKQAYDAAVDKVAAVEQFIFEGVFTHFSSADEDNTLTEFAYDKFLGIISDNKPQYIHCQNSAATLRYDCSECNAVRLGISLYGYYPSEFIRAVSNVKLQPAVQLVSTACFIKNIKSGDTVSYGATYTAQSNQVVATFPIGYADGLPRAMQGYNINLEGTEVPIIGRVCMDQMMARVPDDTPLGAQCIIIDDNADSNQSLERVAQQLGTITYEVLTSLSRRLPKRYYIADDVEVYNELMK